MDDVKIPMPVLISHETFPRTVFRLHDAAYDEWVMILVSTGRFEFTMLGQRRVAGPGDVVVFPQNVRFQRRIIEPVDIHYFVFLWDCPEQQLHRDGFYRYGALSTGSPRRIAEDDRLLRGLGLRNDLRARQLREAMLRDIWLTHLMSVPEESAGGRIRLWMRRFAIYSAPCPNARAARISPRTSRCLRRPFPADFLPPVARDRARTSHRSVCNWRATCFHRVI